MRTHTLVPSFLHSLCGDARGRWNVPAGWKSLLLADAPRQVINSLTLYSFGKAFNFTTDISKYTNDGDGHFSLVRAGVLCTMIFTVVIFAGSAILLFIAALMYVPLLCYIQGNLKEYCCHKIDKR